MVPPDSQLIEQILQGREDAFSALYRQRQGPVFRFALHMTGSVAVAEDVTQETFLALLQQAGRYDPLKGTLASFLFGIARNQVLRRLEPDLCPEDCELADPAQSIEEHLHRQQTVEQVRAAVLRLPALYREVVALCDLGEVSYEDAAEVLGCPVGTIRSRLSRGREMLARKLRILAVGVS